MRMGRTRSVVQQLELIEGHLKSNPAMVWKVSDELCSRTTLKNLIKNKDTAHTKTTVKRKILKQIAEMLPDEHMDKYISSYRFMLEEMKVDEFSQKEITKLVGVYNIECNIPTIELSINKIMILTIEEPFFPAFYCKVGVNNADEERVCDGFVFVSGNRLIFSGMSEYINMFMVFRKPIDPRENVVNGHCIVEDRFASKTYITSSAMYAKSNKQINVEKVRQEMGDIYITA